MQTDEGFSGILSARFSRWALLRGNEGRYGHGSGAGVGFLFWLYERCRDFGGNETRWRIKTIITKPRTMVTW